MSPSFRELYLWRCLFVRPTSIHESLFSGRDGTVADSMERSTLLTWLSPSNISISSKDRQLQVSL